MMNKTPIEWCTRFLESGDRVSSSVPECILLQHHETVLASQQVRGLILGAVTGKNPVGPEIAWVEGVVSQCRENQISLFLKNNLLKYYPAGVQDFPTVSL